MLWPDDLQPLRAGDETSTGVRILTARRGNYSADGVRAINRLQAQLLEYLQALERACCGSSTCPDYRP